MPSAAVDTAFKARLASLWTSSPVVGGSRPGDLPENIPEPPSNTDAFLVVQYPVVNSEKPVLNGKYFEDGAARLVLNVQSGVGLSAGLAWADTLANLFRDEKFGGVETFVPSAPIINNTNDDGNWFELAIIIPYRYQFNS